VIVDGVQVGLHAMDDGSPSGPTVGMLRGIVRDTVTAVRIEAGTVSILESSIHGASGNGVEVNAGHLEMASSLVTDGGDRCVRVASGATAALDFVTITRCAVGIEQIDSGASGVSVTSSIVYGNTLADLAGVDCGAVFNTDTLPACCSVNGNLCVDPGFVDPAGLDYRLAAGSACVDAGFDPATFSGNPVHDRDGNPRLLDGDFDGHAHPDCGALEQDRSAGRVPGEIHDVVFTSLVHLEWTAEPSSATYGVYRGALSLLGYDFILQCVQEVSSNEKWLGPVPPPSGDAFIYLVTGRTEDKTEGTLGFGMAAERSNFRPCP